MYENEFYLNNTKETHKILKALALSTFDTPTKLKIITCIKLHTIMQTYNFV